MTGVVRLAIVATHPIQHFCPLYRELANDPRVELKVFFASRFGAMPYFDPGFGRNVSWGHDITAGFDHEFLTEGGGTIEEAVKSARVGASLVRFDPDVVQVYGYGDALARRTLLWCLTRRRPAVMVSDSERRSDRSPLRRAAKQLVLRAILSIPRAFLTIGDENEGYYTSYGISPRKFHRSPIPIDSPMFDEVLAVRGAARAKTRRGWGAAADDFVLLAVGKSVPRKRHLDIIEAVGALDAEDREKVVVVLAGGGEQTDSLVDRGGALGVRVRALGFVPVDDLPAAYVAADALIHPSEADPHPLAVAEAVYSGLPVVVSDRVGSWGASDDARPANGVQVPLGDIQGYAAAVKRMLHDPAWHEAASQASVAIGRERTLQQSARAYVDGVLASLRAPSPAAGSTR